MTTDAIRRLIRLAPGLGRITRRSVPFTDSTEYWKRRYEAGFQSGAGSRAELAAFKAEFLNRFVAEHGIASVIELGSGDGAQLALAAYPRYAGHDISACAVELCRERFADDPTKTFAVYEAESFRPEAHRAELALSLDVIYHLVETPVFETHMRHLFDAATRFVVIYSSDRDALASDPHVRHRAFSSWVEAHRPAWQRAAVVRNPFPWEPGNPNTTWSDFHVFTRCVGGQAGADSCPEHHPA